MWISRKSVTTQNLNTSRWFLRFCAISVAKKTSTCGSLFIVVSALFSFWIIASAAKFSGNRFSSKSNVTVRNHFLLKKLCVIMLIESVMSHWCVPAPSWSCLRHYGVLTKTGSYTLDGVDARADILDHGHHQTTFTIFWFDDVLMLNGQHVHRSCQHH